MTDREPTVYRLRIVLDHIEPPIWREFEVASVTRLDGLHDVVQVVMGWENYHLHRFTTSDNLYDPQFLTEFDIEEGDVGTAESDVRVDEVLCSADDRLQYVYDFGDGWQHTVTLVGERPLGSDDDLPTCLDGARACPSEDCGGTGGYAELVEDLAAARRGDELDDWRTERLRWLAGDTPLDVVAASLETFDADAANAVLARRVRFASLPGALGDLVRRLPGAHAFSALTDLVDAIPLDEPVDVSPDLAGTMTEPFAWMIRRAGDDGLSLTAAGYLKPVDVSALATVLDLSDEWIGKFNREDQTPQVGDFRDAMRHLGLMRRVRGRLVATNAALSLVDDPVKAGARLAGLPVGSVRPPLVDPSPEHIERLEQIIGQGRKALRGQSLSTMSVTRR